MDYLVGKFRSRLAGERLILVLKAFAPPPPEQLRRLRDLLQPALRRQSSCLLVVTPVAFMAPGESADVIDHSNWNRVLMKAYWLALSPARYALPGWWDQPRSRS